MDGRLERNRMLNTKAYRIAILICIMLEVVSGGLTKTTNMATFMQRLAAISDFDRMNKTIAGLD